MSDHEHLARPKLNAERFFLIYAPLILAWWIGTHSIGREIGNSPMGWVLGTIIIAIVAYMVRRIELIIYNGGDAASCVKYILLALIPLVVTFAANIITIYPFMMKKALLEEELIYKKGRMVALRENLEATKIDKNIDDWNANIDKDILQLKSQITSDYNIGVGKKSNEILDRLSGKLNSSITRHSLPKKSKEAAEIIAKKYEADILEIKRNFPTYNKFLKKAKILDDAIAELNIAIINLDKSSKAIQAGDERWKESTIKSLQDAVNAYNGVNEKVKASLAIDGFGQNLVLENGSEDKLAHVLESVYKNLGRGGTIAAIILALILDVWALFLAILFTNKVASPAPNFTIQQENYVYNQTTVNPPSAVLQKIKGPDTENSLEQHKAKQQDNKQSTHNVDDNGALGTNRLYRLNYCEPTDK